jgi:hypothetical protein
MGSAERPTPVKNWEGRVQRLSRYDVSTRVFRDASAG